MAKYSPTAAACVSRQYAIRFPSITLQERVEGLLADYPDVTAPSFISWEGAILTHCDTSAKLRNLLAALREAPPETLTLGQRYA